MPDNWGFVGAAYGLTAVVLALYWRHLVRKEKEARANTARTPQSSTPDREIAERSRGPSAPGHPRNDPASRYPLQ